MVLWKLCQLRSAFRRSIYVSFSCLTLIKKKISAYVNKLGSECDHSRVSVQFQNSHPSPSFSLSLRGTDWIGSSVNKSIPMEGGYGSWTFIKPLNMFHKSDRWHTSVCSEFTDSHNIAPGMLSYRLKRPKVCESDEKRYRSVIRERDEELTCERLSEVQIYHWNAHEREHLSICLGVDRTRTMMRTMAIMK